MYAYELYEQTKSAILDVYRQKGKDIIYNGGHNLYNQLKNIEGFSQTDAYATVIGGFACVACNDGKISYDEYEALSKLFGNPMSYDEFFDLMSRYNKQDKRDRTVALFNRINSPEVAHMFIMFCISASIVDGNINTNEEMFCTSLCEVYLNRFFR